MLLELQYIDYVVDYFMNSNLYTGNL